MVVQMSIKDFLCNEDSTKAVHDQSYNVLACWMDPLKFTNKTLSLDTTYISTIVCVSLV